MDTCSVRGDTVSQTNVLSFARINVIYLPELGGQLPPLTPRLVRLCLSCTMRNVEQNARICLLMGTWLVILDVARVILCGDDRFILCADDHLSALFARLYAIGQIAKQFIFVSIAPHESIPVNRNRRSCNHELPLCVLRSLVHCFRMSVR